jgi:hypothetical protein
MYHGAVLCCGVGGCPDYDASHVDCGTVSQSTNSTQVPAVLLKSVDQSRCRTPPESPRVS